VFVTLGSSGRLARARESGDGVFTGSGDYLNVTGGDLVVECLRRAGVKWIYGIPGGQTLAIMDALYAQRDIRFVTTHHEGAAACMADAYGRLTGKVGVCLATTGPGATNLLTGIGGAYKDSSPVLVLVANNRLQHLGRDDAQAADHVAVFQSLTKASAAVYHSADITPKLQWAFTVATSGCPGPVLLDFPRDVLEGEADRRTLVSFRPPVAVRPVPPAEAIGQIISHLVEAERPVFWAGNGVKLARAGSRLLTLAELLAIPCVTTYNGIGALPTDHRLCFGTASRMGTGLGIQAVTESDCLVAIGNSLNAVSTGRWTMQLPETILQIDIDAAALGRNYPVRIGVAAEAGVALSAIAQAVDVAGAAAARERHTGWITHLDAVRVRWRAQVAQDEVHGAPIRPQMLMRLLSEVLPGDATLVVDAGNPGLWSFLVKICAQTTYMKPVGFGNMGFALPASIAAKLEQPDRPVLCLVGDGSLGMTLAELETAVRERVAIAIIVMNDGGYGNIRQEQAQRYGDRFIGVDFGDIDYAAVARALGVEAERVTSSHEMRHALERALRSTGPYLVDVPISLDDVRTYPPFCAIEQGE
jgi:acetolactate synthase-1/2/3 large subunit